MAMRIHQPIPDAVAWVATPDGTAQVLPYQIVVTVSITANTATELPRDAPRFPAVLDTGNNHNFAIRHEHAVRWTRLKLPKRGVVKIGDTIIPLHAANVWIHSNSGQPVRLRMEEGIAIYPAGRGEPRQASDPRAQGIGEERSLDRGRREEQGSHAQRVMKSLATAWNSHTSVDSYKQRKFPGMRPTTARDLHPISGRRARAAASHTAQLVARAFPLR